jgi:hypothetical protein
MRYQSHYYFFNGILYILTNSKLLPQSGILIIIERNNMQQKLDIWNINLNEYLGILGQQKDLQKVLQVVTVKVNVELISLDERLG